MSVVEKKRLHREKRRKRVRRKVSGTAERPRLSVYRSNVHIYAQLVDDDAGNTLAAADSREVDEVETEARALPAATPAEVGAPVGTVEDPGGASAASAAGATVTSRTGW